MDEMLIILGLLALLALGVWLMASKSRENTRPPEPRVTIRAVRRYVPPPSRPPQIPIDATTGQPKVIVKGCRQISLRDFPQLSSPRIVVERQLRPLYEEKGWRKEGRVYRGYYRANGRRWRGEIRELHRGFFEAFIWNPPLDALERHPHGPCFQRRNGRFNVHLNKMPRDVDHLITNVETILKEALTSF